MFFESQCTCDDWLLGVRDITQLIVADTSHYNSPTESNALSPEDAAAADEHLTKCTVRVTGMTCSSCVANIEKHLATFKGK